MSTVSSISLLAAGLLPLLAGCTPAASALQLRSAKQLGCRPAYKLKVSGHTPGDPRQNQPERWEVVGCGVAYRCSSFLMNTGQPAHTECLEPRREVARRQTGAQRSQLSVRLKRASAEEVAEISGCAPDQVQVKGELVQGTAYIHMLRACGAGYRCLTLAAGREQESTSCEELASDP